MTVADRWHCFDIFREDIKHLKGFDEESFYSGEIELDKDGLGGDVKIYSKETCQWVSRKKNMSLSKRWKYQPHLVQVKAVALSPEDEMICIINIPLFADEYVLLRSGIHGVIGGHGPKTHRGWCFKRVENLNEVTEINRKDFMQKRHGVVPYSYEVIKKGEIIKTFNSVEEAAKYMQCSVSNINQRTRNGQGYNKYGITMRRIKKEID